VAGAYVEIDECVQYLPVTSQLRIYSAGVWHNMVLSTVCWIGLIILPTLFTIFYYEPVGAVVMNYPSKHSIFHGFIYPGDIIVSVNNKQIRHCNELHYFIESFSTPQLRYLTDERFNFSGISDAAIIAFNETTYDEVHYLSPSSIIGQGYCVQRSNNNDNNLDCCSFALSGVRKVSDMTCFLIIEAINTKTSSFRYSDFQCTHASDVIHSHSNLCRVASDCGDNAARQCLHPVSELPKLLFQIQFSSNKHIVVEGNPAQLFQLIKFGQYDLKFKRSPEQRLYWLYVLILSFPTNLIFFLKLTLQVAFCATTQ